MTAPIADKANAANEPPLTLRRAGALVHLQLNRPAALNALDLPLARALADASAALVDDASVRAVVLSGAGRGFCAGGDVRLMRADPVNVARELIAAVHEAVANLNRLRVPVLASVHGVVAGAGVSLLLAADLAIAADTTRFNLAYVNIGTSCDGGSSWALPRVVGLRKAFEIAMLGETIDAAQALQLGLVNRVVPAAELEAQTALLAQQLARGPTQALGEIKQLLRASQQATLHAQLDAEAQAFLRCAASADFSAALDAFAARRPPQFSGC